MNHHSNDALGQRLHSTARSDAASAGDSHAPRSVRRSIARRRALFSGSMGLAAAAIVGSIAVGGLGLTEPTDAPTPTPTPDLSISDSTRAYATVPLPAFDESYGQAIYEHPEITAREFCGGPAPAPTTVVGDLTATFDTPEHLDLDRRINGSIAGPDSRASISLTYGADDELPAFSGGIMALLIQDDIVVGFTTNYLPSVVNTFEEGQQRTHPWRWESWINNCAQDATTPELPGGDYEMVFVSRVHNSREMAANWSLALDGYQLPAAEDLAAYREGSFQCEQWRAWNQYEPLTCSPHAVVGFELDQEAGTATIPYDTSYYSRDIDITFVSHRTPATLSEPMDEYDYTGGLPMYEAGAVPVCGDVYAHIDRTSSLMANLPEMFDAPDNGETINPTLWTWARGWDTATVAVPQTPRVWLLNNKEIDVTRSEEDPGVVSYYYGYEVVGWLETESNRPSVEISNYDGPASWPLTVSDMQWCDGYDDSTIDTSFGRERLAGLIAEPITVTLNTTTLNTTTLDDGTQEESSSLLLTPGSFY